MCYIAAIKAIDPHQALTPLGEENIQKINKAIQNRLAIKMQGNSHGFYIRNDNKFLRTLDPEIARSTIDSIENFNNTLLHFRLASAGEITPRNIHGWQRKQWVFIHNGHVHDFASSTYPPYNKKEDKKTDSLKFFEYLAELLPEELDDKVISETVQASVDEKNFWGRAMLYHLPSDTLYMWGDWEVYIINQIYMVISSAKVDFTEAAWWSNIHGMSFIKKEEFKFNILHNSIDEFGKIENFSKDDFVYQAIDIWKVSDTRSNWWKKDKKREKSKNKAVTITDSVTNTDESKKNNGQTTFGFIPRRTPQGVKTYPTTL